MLDDEEIVEYESPLIELGKDTLKDQASAAIFELYKTPVLAAIQGTALWLSQHDGHILLAIIFMASWYALLEVSLWIFKRFNTC